jgi:molecular chaperone DnaK (HSP70)
MKQLIGISVGSLNSTIGVLKNNNVDIILSESSNRGIPTISSYSDRDRLYGDGANATIKGNFKRSVSYPNRYLGMQGDSTYLAEEAKYASCQPSVDNKNKVGFEIDYKGEKDFYYPESVMGLYFDKLKQNWKRAGYETKDVVVTVPDYFSAHERKAMIEALTIADLNCTSLINESSAISLNYGMFRRAQFDDTKPRIVGFVDIGHASGCVFFASFTKNHQKVISVSSERFCGAREFDYLIMEQMSNLFKQKYGSNPMNNPKCRMRMIDAIMKTRKILTANREAGLNVECLMDDEDLHYNLTREEFEKIIEPVLNKIKNLFTSALNNALAEAKFQLPDLHSVEMVGDAVRTPIIQQIVKDVFGLELSKTLMPDETLARGATLYAAMNSPYFSMKDFTFENYNPYSIILEYPFLSNFFNFRRWTD